MIPSALPSSVPLLSTRSCLRELAYVEGPLIHSPLRRKKSHHHHSIFSPLFATNLNESGSYVDLGIITSNEANYNDSLFQNLVHTAQSKSENPTTSPPQQSSYNKEEWRSNHWIVLIDDEPSIRLAIGDYLHSMGYTMITACDGPQSFLDVLLYSCGGWSLLMEDDRNNERPPWMNGDETMIWRLPNCIISDIRMPGGVDGVQLLELLRLPNDDSENDDNIDNVVKKKRRSKKGQKRSDNEYDEKDDFDLLDAIVGNSVVEDGSAVGKQQQQLQARKIVTAIDQAKQKLDVIRQALTYHQADSNFNSLQSQQQYPTSLLQIPVILLTAKAMVSDRIVGFKAGANNYLPKPFRPEELLGMVDSLLRKQERERKEWMGGGEYVAAAKKEDKKYVDIESYSASAQQIKDLTAELTEIKNLLKDEAQRQTDAKVEQDEMERLSKLLPNALWMYVNGERRKRSFSLDHIRSILIFCFDDTSLVGKRIVKRNDLLAELDRMDDENPDVLQNFLLD